MNTLLNNLLTTYRQNHPQRKNAPYRHRAKLAVRGRRKSPIIGHFIPGSHEIASLENSQEHVPIINEKIPLIKKALIDFAISPYQEPCHQGLVRYLQFTAERNSENVELALSLNIPDFSLLPLHFFNFLTSLKSHFTSIWLNAQPERTNHIFGPLWHQYHGNALLTQPILETQIAFHPATFMQANLDLFDKVVESIQKNIHPHKKTLELYAGVGAIGRNLSNPVTYVEINPFAKCCMPSHLNFIEGTSTSHAHLIFEHDVIIVDPPRKGLDPEVLQALATTSSQQLIYLSCNPKTLARDLSELPKWRINHLEQYDFFPNTPHIETLVFLENEGRTAFPRLDWFIS